MDLSIFGNWASIIGLIITVIGLLFGSKYLLKINKKTGHDDRSINIDKNNTITNSFNKEK